jgi:flagellar protein FlbD
MVFVTLQGVESKRILLNSRQIERIVPNINTIIILVDGKKILVDETPEEIVYLIMQYEAEVLALANRIKES